MEGVISQISIGQESAWGTAVTPTVSISVLPSDGLQAVQEAQDVEGIDGNPAKAKDFFSGKRTFEGGIEMPAYPQALGYFLKSLLGAVNTTAPEASVKLHTYSETVAKPSLTLEQAIGSNFSKRVAGVVARGMEISAKTGEIVNVKFDLIGKSIADSTKISGAYETRRPFNWTDISTLSIGGTDIKAKCEEFSISYNSNLEVFHGFGSYDPQNFYAQQSEVSGSMTLILDASTKAYITSLLSTTQAEVILTMQGELVGATLKDMLRITLSKCAFTKAETPLDFGYTALSLEFKARRDATNGLIKVELQNGVTSY